MIVTIDGPTASGKTTVARMLAKQLGFYYLSSGLLFRGLAYVLMHEYQYQEEQMANPRSEDITAIVARFIYSYASNSQEQLSFDGKNIAPFLRDKKISDNASRLAMHPAVRNALEQLQHRIADSHNLVAEGRDMGSAVFPQAQIKFYLTASLEVRAQRWRNDQAAKGRIIPFAQALEEVHSRDERDMTRLLAPLCTPQGAIIIDDSDLNQEQVLALMGQEISLL
jgi:CMP/dCMP kinase